jgi:uncharacterized protein YjbI with pentapeptide repeats
MVWEITSDELWFRYADGERDFRGIKLIQSETATETQMIDLQGFNLQNINLRGADLSRADLSGADLSRADLFGASLRDALLKQAILRNASLYSANLNSCGLQNADLTGTCLDHINAISADFCGAKFGYGFKYAILVGTGFENALIPKESICGYGNLIWDTIMPDGTIEHGPYFGEF